MGIWSTIYGWLSGIYGQNMHNFLSGMDEEGGFTEAEHYFSFGLGTLIVVLALAIIYYLFLRNPRYLNWKSWLLFLSVSVAFGFAFAYGRTSSMLMMQDIPEFLLLDEENRLLITGEHCAYFGLANAIYAFVLWILLTMMLKWFSKSAKYVPF